MNRQMQLSYLIPQMKANTVTSDENNIYILFYYLNMTQCQVVDLWDHIYILFYLF
jgi:hypothetical protein